MASIKSCIYTLFDSTLGGSNPSICDSTELDKYQGHVVTGSCCSAEWLNSRLQSMSFLWIMLLLLYQFILNLLGEQIVIFSGF